MRLAVRRLVRIVVATMVVGLGVVALSEAEGSRAGALCDGGASGPDGYPVNASWGAERTWGSHCWSGPDAVFTGEITDAVTDGSCVWVEYWEGGGSTWTQQFQCTTGAWGGYAWWDQNGDTTALARLCRNQGCTVWNWNWGY